MSQLNVGRLNISERLKLPNYNESQRDALSAELGMMIYNTTSELVEVYNGSNWTNAAGGGGADGSSSDQAADSVTALRDDAGITTDGVYWLKDALGATYQAYCTFNTTFDGGGWVLLWNINGSTANSSLGGHTHWDNSTFWGSANEQQQSSTSPWQNAVKTRAWDKHPISEFLIILHNTNGYDTNNLRGYGVYQNNNFPGQTYYDIASGGNNKIVSSGGRKSGANYVGNLTWNSRRPNSRGGDPFIDGTVNGNNNANDNLAINTTGYWSSSSRGDSRFATTAGSGNSTYGHTHSGMGIRHGHSGWGYYASMTYIQAYCEPNAMYCNSSSCGNNYTGSPESGAQVHTQCNNNGWADGYIDCGYSVFVR